MSNTFISTERLIIRRFNEGDLTDLTQLIRDKMASRYSPYDNQWPTDDENIKNILGYFINNDAWYAIELAGVGGVVGFVVASYTDNEKVLDLGYTIRTDYQHNGFAYEACLALINHCESALGIEKFTAGTADCNIPSVKLLLKLGFIKTRSLEASFANDTAGNPIVFEAGAYEYKCKSHAKLA